jgi:hypothetical protein
MPTHRTGHLVGMSEHQHEQSPSIDFGEVAEEPPEETVAAEEDAVAGEPGWDARDDGGTVPEDDAQ